MSDKERIAELTDAFNRVCAENYDFIAESIKDEARIAELEAQLADANEMLEKCNSKFIVALEAENARLKMAMDKYSEAPIFTADRAYIETIYNAPEQPLPSNASTPRSLFFVAVEKLLFMAEEYDFDDGLGRGAPQEYWDALEAALEDAFDKDNKNEAV